MPNKRQAIIWTNADPIHWRIDAALGGGGGGVCVCVGGGGGGGELRAANFVNLDVFWVRRAMADQLSWARLNSQRNCCPFPYTWEKRIFFKQKHRCV